MVNGKRTAQILNLETASKMGGPAVKDRSIVTTLNHKHSATGTPKPKVKSFKSTKK
jgi:hypothetical protein